jgi:reactive chlorine resistance protein C
MINAINEAPRSARGAAREGVLGERLEAVGGGILRYGAVVMLLYFGAFKFTATEAEAIVPLIANSPLLAWLYAVLDRQAVSSLIGATELFAAVLIALRPVAPRLSAFGSALAVPIFLTTLSFLVTTPGVWARVPDFFLPIPSGPGGFILKDVFLLGAAVWSAGEALGARRHH